MKSFAFILIMMAQIALASEQRIYSIPVENDWQRLARHVYEYLEQAPKSDLERLMAKGWNFGSSQRWTLSNEIERLMGQALFRTRGKSWVSGAMVASLAEAFPDDSNVLRIADAIVTGKIPEVKVRGEIGLTEYRLLKSIASDCRKILDPR